MSPVDALTARLLAERHFPKYETNEWAVLCLEAGFDSKHLRMLAATPKNDWPSVKDDIEQKAKAELGWDQIPRYEYLLEYARLLASDILSGRVDSIEGSRRMYNLMHEADLHDHLSGWYEIDEMIFSQQHFEKTGKKDYYYVDRAEFDRIVNDNCKDFLVATRPKTAPLPETGFDEAESIFREFLVNNGHNGEVLWVFADDLIIRQGELACYLPDPEQNRELARCLYEIGVRRGHGIALHAFSQLNDKLLAYILLPQDEEDSQSKLMSEYFVKFSVRSGFRYKVRQITSPLLWNIKNLFTNEKKRVGNESEIPFRRSVSDRFVD